MSFGSVVPTMCSRRPPLGVGRARYRVGDRLRHDLGHGGLPGGACEGRSVRSRSAGARGPGHSLVTTNLRVTLAIDCDNASIRAMCVVTHGLGYPRSRTRGSRRTSWHPLSPITCWSGCATGAWTPSSATRATASTASSPPGAAPRTTRGSSRRGTRRWPRSRRSATPSSPAGSASAWRPPGPGAIHLLNGLYDAKLDHVPVVAIVGQTNRSAMGGSYQQEVDLLSLFKDVASDYVQMVTVPEQLPNVLDRAIRTALGRRAPTAIIIPADVQELEYSAPTHAFKMVPSSLGHRLAAAVAPDDDAVAPRRRRPQRGRRRSRCWSGPGARGARGGDRAGRRPARRRRGQGAAGQGRAVRRAAVRDRLDRAAGHPAQLRDDDGLRHAAHRRVELPLHPVPARVRPGAGGADRHRPGVDRHALPVRGQPGRRRGRHAAGADPAAGAQGRPLLAGGHRVRRRPLVGDHGDGGGGRGRPGQPDAAVRASCRRGCPTTRSSPPTPARRRTGTPASCGSAATCAARCRATWPRWAPACRTGSARSSAARTGR